jgi:uncharacterized membrane protein
VIKALIILGVIALGTVIGLAAFFWLAFIIIAHEDKNGH